MHAVTEVQLAPFPCLLQETSLKSHQPFAGCHTKREGPELSGSPLPEDGGTTGAVRTLFPGFLHGDVLTSCAAGYQCLDRGAGTMRQEGKEGVQLATSA